jgi:hypothetical protein
MAGGLTYTSGPIGRLISVMAGLDSCVMPALGADTHVFPACNQEDMGGRAKPGHDGEEAAMTERRRP